MTVLHVPLLPAVVRTTGSLLSFVSHPALGELGARQQLTVLKRRHPKPKLSPLDKLFWVSARRFWSAWKSSLIIVTPETVVRWHRAGFRRYWSLISRVKERVGRKKLSREIRDLIFQMVKDNPTWGTPRIHGELLMLSLSERSISSWMKRAPRDPELARRWQAFVRNHRDAIAAMDFFTVPTVMFQLLYCFFIISHERRQILHVNVTRLPTSTWIAQQLREAFPYESAPKFVLFDNDQKYGLEVPAALRSLQITAVQTSIQSPWQKGVAERRVGSFRRDLLDHIIALNERHLKRLLAAYTFLLSRRPYPSCPRKETPGRRIRSAATGPVICHARLGGLHHRYEPRGLRSGDIHWRTPCGTSVGSSVINKEQLASTQHPCPPTQPISGGEISLQDHVRGAV